jgi:hypothetical protein
MAPLTTGSTPASRRGPELPAFSRTRRRTFAVPSCGLNGLRNLQLVLLLLQLSTLLLVLAGPVPPRLPWPGSRESAVPVTDRP